LNEAINELDRSDLFRSALGNDFIDEFVSLKQEEWLDYHRHVSDWETQRYVSFF